ncbi:MAG: hypothetical protein OEY36_10855 [Gammaproteobacteria bacterium]|nr:hypothetical protein [Gammaproteobacteria bacterium]
MNNKNTKKIIVCVFLLALVITVMGGWLDSKGTEYTEATFKRALIAFGIAKGLNGVISVAQGTEVALQPAGIGVNFTPGQILDPVNDVIEQFSWIMLASTASVGVQKILLTISQWPLFSYSVMLLLLLAAASYWFQPLLQSRWRPLLFKVMLVLVFLRFSVPMIAIGSEFIYQQFLSEQYVEATLQLERTTEKVSEINQNVKPDISQVTDSSVIEKIKQLYGSAAAAIDIDARIERYKTAASEATGHVINLIVVFIFQTILFPIGFLFVMYRLLKYFLTLAWLEKK